MKTDDIRQAYLDFFLARDHRLVPSASLIPHDDPSLLFTSAGMVPFKKFYSGEADPLPYRRAVSCQKCFRAGGKASDLENVGKTLRHHTFFEMLGNFSFGDYFKREACAWALEFSRDVLRLDMSRVWVTYHEGDPETRDIWALELGFPAERIVPLGDKDNWWGPAGETGACGPCSEMHYDRGPEFGTGPEDRIGGDTDRYLEYWNMVFPQFDHQRDGSRPTLKNRGIDTGMGLARVAAIMQGARSAYTIDAMWPITKAAAEACGVDYERASERERLAVNVVADHARALTFVISEGQVIGNTERGYVLKRVLRRAARYARSIGQHEPFIHRLVPVVVETMGATYPELKEKPGFVARIIEADEEQFHRTMDRGMKMIEDELEALRRSGEGVFPGALAFHLWQQEGIPHEDVLEIAADAGLTFDAAGYREAEKKHVAQSRGAASGAGDGGAETWRALAEEFGATTFVGYDRLDHAATVLAIVRGGGRVAAADQAEADYEVLVDETPFYAEAGGQVGDRGMIVTQTGRLIVRDTRKTAGGLYRHVGVLAEGTIEAGQVAKAEVDPMLRGATQCNHSATHLMQGALKRVLGAHVTQRGSLVHEGGLRFDFTHLEALTPAQLRQVEELVNGQIRANTPVATDVLDAAAAAAVPGVIAPFDERYGETIRVVSMGRPVSGDDAALRWWDVEFCGGTHVARTGDIGLFVIRGESSIAQGIRRIEALTADGAESYLMLARDAYRDVQSLLSVDGARVRESVERLLDARRALEAEVASLKKQLAAGGLGGILAAGRDLGDVTLFTHRFEGATQDEMRHVALEVAREAGDRAVVVFGSAVEGKAALLVMVGPAGKGRLHAGHLVRDLAKVVGGGGGGKPDFAQAGGKQPERLGEALAQAEALVAAALAAGGGAG